jgi:hypothetical protein
MALWPIFRPAGRRTRSSRTDQSMLVARALKIGQIADGGMPPTYETMHYTKNRLCVAYCSLLRALIGVITLGQFASRSGRTMTDCL